MEAYCSRGSRGDSAVAGDFFLVGTAGGLRAAGVPGRDDFIAGQVDGDVDAVRRE